MPMIHSTSEDRGVCPSSASIDSNVERRKPTVQQHTNHRSREPISDTPKTLHTAASACKISAVQALDNTRIPPVSAHSRDIGEQSSAADNADQVSHDVETKKAIPRNQYNIAFSRRTGIRRVRTMPDLSSTMQERSTMGDIHKTRTKLLSIPSTRKQTKFDPLVGEKFARKIVDIVNDGATCLLVSIAHQLGLFSAMGRLNDRPHSVRTIAEATNNLKFRYVEELLLALTCAGIIEETVHLVPPPQTKNIRERVQGRLNVGSTADGHQAQNTAGAGPTTVQRKYRLPAEHAAFLTWSSDTDNLALLAQYVPVLGRLEDDVVSGFRTGSGVSWTKYAQFDLISTLETSQTVGAIDKFENDFLDLVPGLKQELQEGISILCLGNGLSEEYQTIASTYPMSWFTVYDACQQRAMAARRSSQQGRGAVNIHYCALSSAKNGSQYLGGQRLPRNAHTNNAMTTKQVENSVQPSMPERSHGQNEYTSPETQGRTMHNAGTQSRLHSEATLAVLQEKNTYDAALIIDGSIIRDSPCPHALLRSICCSLRPGRSLLYLEYIDGPLTSNASSDVVSAHRIGSTRPGNKATPFLYGLSTMQSVPLGLAAGGPALGRMWGSQNAAAALKSAGFVSVSQCKRPEDRVNVVLVAQAPAAFSCGLTTPD